MDNRLQRGDKAPEFTLDSTEGRISLSDYRGKWIVLYFYPKDDTPGCTTEACDFRDVQANHNMNATVLGVSGDDLESHRKFAEKNALNFPLLYDEGNEVAKAYGAYGEKTSFGKTSMGIIRSTFIIDPEGNIHEAMYNVKAQGHAAEIADTVAASQRMDNLTQS